MIYLLTDYGYAGPYLGQLHAVLRNYVSRDQWIDLCHDLPRFNPKASAYLLPAFCGQLKNDDIVLAVVDPGVGSSRNPVWLTSDGVHFIGPDNGLFTQVVRQSNSVLARLLPTPDNISASFHGRDLFAPVAGKLAKHETPICKPISIASLFDREWPISLEEVVYIDSFGNVMLGIQADDIADDTCIEVAGARLSNARTFGSVNIGELFWYRNSIGLVELAKNSGSIAKQLKLMVGDSVCLHFSC